MTDKKPKPTHYKVVCHVLYTSDEEELDAKVAAFKARGWTKANRSAVIRLALSRLVVDEVPMIKSGAEIDQMIAGREPTK